MASIYSASDFPSFRMPPDPWLSMLENFQAAGGGDKLMGEKASSSQELCHSMTIPVLMLQNSSDACANIVRELDGRLQWRLQKGRVGQ